MIQVHYFASIREALGREKDSLQIPEGVGTLDELVDFLIAENGEPWRKSLRDSSILAALNQTVVPLSSALNDGDEIAFFPPVTGG